MTRDEMPTPRAIVVATASVGERIAPSAMHQARSSDGMMRWNTNPSSTELTMTSATASPLIAVNSRRKFIAGIETALPNRSGGRTTARMRSGSTSISGTNGRNETPIPTSTRTRGAATCHFGAMRAVTAITTTAATATRMAMSMAPTPCSATVGRLGRTRRFCTPGPVIGTASPLVTDEAVPSSTSARCVSRPP